MNNGTRPFTNEEKEQIENVLKTERDKMLFILGLKTGFRISELISIKTKELLEYGNVKSLVSVSKSKTKGKVSTRSIPISESTRKRLYLYINTLSSDNEYLFQSAKGGRISRIQAYRIIKEAVRTLELKGKLATHSLRKSFAEKVYENLDKDIVKLQRAMGHKSINSTIAYLSFKQEDIDKAILDL